METYFIVQEMVEQFRNPLQIGAETAGAVAGDYLRHLFVRSFYKACRDVVQFADVLGYTLVETTRICLVSTGAEHARRMNRLGLVLSG